MQIIKRGAEIDSSGTRIFLQGNPQSSDSLACGDSKRVYLRPSRGVATLMLIGFMGLFLLILGTISSFAFQQAKYGRVLYDREQALHRLKEALETQTTAPRPIENPS